jgi:hypothetical protein
MDTRLEYEAERLNRLIDEQYRIIFKHIKTLRQIEKYDNILDVIEGRKIQA